MKIVKTFAKILLAVLSVLSFLCAFLFVGAYWLGAESYLYYTQVATDCINVCLAVFALLFLLLLVLSVLLFIKKVGKNVKTVCALFLVSFMLASVISSAFSMLWVGVIGTYGCSYTEDIANYGRYDREFNTAHFPESMTEDMTVVDFVYYFKYADCDHADIYLEVKLADVQTVERYIAAAVASLGEYGLCEHPNPYNEKYTDILTWGQWGDPKEPRPNYNGVIFGEYESGNRYTDIFYCAVSYSYEELTVIYSYTSIGNDIFVGDDPDNGYYYPKILRRFGVEWDVANNFRSYDILHPEGE